MEGKIRGGGQKEGGFHGAEQREKGESASKKAQSGSLQKERGSEKKKNGFACGKRGGKNVMEPTSLSQHIGLGALKVTTERRD